MVRFLKRKKRENEPSLDLTGLIKQLEKSNDFQCTMFFHDESEQYFSLSYFNTLIDDLIVRENILPYLLQCSFSELDDFITLLPNSNCEITSDLTYIENSIMTGHILLQLEGEENKVAIIEAKNVIGREIAPPEIEFNVGGAKVAFVESLDKNLNLIRSELPVKELVTEELTVGSLSKRKVVIMYLDGITNMEDVTEMRRRIEKIQFDFILSNDSIEEFISDNIHSPFQQIINTERPTRVAANIANGKVAVFVDGSPSALVAPTTLFSFLGSLEDYLINWVLGTFARILRLFGITFSIFATPAYVAILTFHPEIIPKDLIGPLVSSRENVPFPPLIEALFLEFTIELLREAGARLPTKVGQTIGIVGGIVLGTATVDAGLTSNILLIFVALGALAAFTTPLYKFSNTIRVIRFPFILAAGIWGLIGINLMMCFFIIHLLRLTSLNRPYLEPLFPPRLYDYRDTLIRSPFKFLKKRPYFTQTKQPSRTTPPTQKE